MNEPRLLSLLSLLPSLRENARPIQPDPPPDMKAPGFWFGLLHGALIPLLFIYSLTRDTRFYTSPNNGPPYDTGFLLGAALPFMSLWTVLAGSLLVAAGWHR